ncbi:uncharacterized protein LOC132747197 [Ruditapes philippinarum]|uniref:uncharacterized protein LOC132747197 n=1 Tax=Ruditapes philippinarum TaxID=129788 RepID=UPI00295BCE13|nr:uncharacterized protein LOC132747197 [Ruditapes philippinarum]
MPQGRTPEDERQYCEDVLGYVFTQGENEFYPKCGQCWCCKPDGEELLVNESLVCYHWTEEDNNAMPQGRTAEDERYYCEDVLGYTFSKGENVNYPNCGICWCCRPKVFPALLVDGGLRGLPCIISCTNGNLNRTSDLP